MRLPRDGHRPAVAVADAVRNGHTVRGVVAVSDAVGHGHSITIPHNVEIDVGHEDTLAHDFADFNFVCNAVQVSDSHTDGVDNRDTIRWLVWDEFWDSYALEFSFGLSDAIDHSIQHVRAAEFSIAVVARDSHWYIIVGFFRIRNAVRDDVDIENADAHTFIYKVVVADDVGYAHRLLDRNADEIAVRLADGIDHRDALCWRVHVRDADRVSDGVRNCDGVSFSDGHAFIFAVVFWDEVGYSLGFSVEDAVELAVGYADVVCGIIRVEPGTCDSERERLAVEVSLAVDDSVEFRDALDDAVLHCDTLELSVELSDAVDHAVKHRHT